jgi:hypothetical protein
MTSVDDPTEGMSFWDKLEYWGDKLANSRSPKQFEEARVKYNELVDWVKGG